PSNHFYRGLARITMKEAEMPNAYLSITGSNQGPFMGDAVRHRQVVRWMPVFDVAHDPSLSPRDPSSGQATGKRRLDPIKIVKALGPASPQILQAAATGEELSVVIQFVHTDSEGEEYVYQTLTLCGAVVQNVKRTVPTGGTRGSGTILFEQVTLDPGEQDLTHKHLANLPWDLLSNDPRRAQGR